MVDYTKWDKLNVSDDEADRKPKVHKFASPHTVTIGGKHAGNVVQVCPSASPGSQVPEVDEGNDDEPIEIADEDVERFDSEEDHREDVLQCRALAERSLKNGDAVEAVRLLEKALRIGGAQCPGLQEVLESARKLAVIGNSTPQRQASTGGHDSHQRNGGAVEDHYFWQQTRDAVEVNVYVPDDTKAKDVALEVSETTVRIALHNLVVFAGDWEFKVVPEEDADWEIVTCDGRRVVRLTVRKADMPGGMSIVVWWPRVLKGEPAIDVSSIQDRKQGAGESFAQAWHDAHTQFRERVKKRVPVPIGPGVSEHDGNVDIDM